MRRLLASVCRTLARPRTSPVADLPWEGRAALLLLAGALLCSLVNPAVALGRMVRDFPSKGFPAQAPRVIFLRGGDLWLWHQGREERLTSGAPAQAPRFSHDGRLLAYWQGGLLKVRSFQGGDSWVIQPTPHQWAGWNPTQHQIAVEDGRGVLLLQITPQGPNTPQRLIDGWGRPVWSPDGRQLAIQRIEQGRRLIGGRSQLALIPVSGGSPKVILTEPFGSKANQRCQPATQPWVWSPDGYRLLLGPGPEVKGPGCPLRLIHLPDSQRGEQNSPVLVTEAIWSSNGMTDSAPVWSPGGRYLAFDHRSQAPPQTRPPSPQPQPDQAIYIYDLEEQSTKQVLESQGGFSPLWGRDGSLFWLRPEGQSASLYHRRRDLPNPLVRGIDLPVGPPRSFDLWVPPTPYGRP